MRPDSLGESLLPRHLETIVFGGEHREQLTPPGEYGLQSLGFRVGKGAGEGSTALAKRARTKASILSVLASLADGLGEVARLSGVDDGHGDPGGGDGGGGQTLVATGGLQDDQFGGDSSKRERSSSTPSWSMASVKDSPWGRRHTSRVLLETSMPPWTSLFGVGLIVWLILPVGVGPALLIRACSAGLEHWPRQPFGLLQKMGATTGAVLRSPAKSMDQGGIGLSRPCWPHCERPEPRYKEDEQRLRASAGERRSLHLRCYESPDGETFGSLMRLFRRFHDRILGSSLVGTENHMLKKVRFEGAPESDGEYDATITPKEVRRTLG